jgi:hypothetical protein
LSWDPAVPIVIEVVPTAWYPVNLITAPPPPPPPAWCPPPEPPAPTINESTNGSADVGRTKFPEDVICDGNDENAAKGFAKAVVGFTAALYKDIKSPVGAITLIDVKACVTFITFPKGDPVVVAPTKYT